MPSRFQEMLINQRQNAETSRAGLKWDPDEDDRMLSLLSEGRSHVDIARSLQRTEGSIKTRLIIYALNKMEKESLSLEQAAEMVSLDQADITAYQDKKHDREEKMKIRRKSSDRKRKSVDRPTNVTNTDIYDLLLSMNRSLETLLSR
jgi:hypothetical protein